MTLDQIIARTKLPIRVDYVLEDDAWWIKTPRLLAQCITSREATYTYLDAVEAHRSA